MKTILSLVAAAALVSLLVFAAPSNRDVPPPTPSSVSPLASTEVAERAKPRDNGFTRVVKVWPTEVYLGDPIYFCAFYENRSGETIRSCGDYIFTPRPLSAYIAWDWSAWELRSPFDAATYRFVPELEGEPAQIELGLDNRDYLPNERGQFICGTLELPPLEDLRSDFWRSFNAVPTDGIECELRSLYDDVSFKIRVKPRPANEARLLERWFDATSPELFPTVIFPTERTPLKVPRDGALKSSARNGVRLGRVLLLSKRYNTSLFTRLGARKPSVPNNPTTLDGWRALEAEFAPSTLRDEMTLTRLQLEYYDAPKGEASAAALQALTDWLQNRPEPQRVVLTESLRSKRPKFRQTPLDEKNAILCNALTSKVDAVP